MLRTICLAILIFGVCCNDSSTAPADMSMQPADMSMQPVDMSMPGPTKLCSSDAWCWENPLPQGNYLFGTWGTAPNNAWAVGAAGTILKWNGTAWAAQTSGTNNNLDAAWVVATNNVWTVGDTGTILHKTQ